MTIVDAFLEFIDIVTRRLTQVSIIKDLTELFRSGNKLITSVDQYFSDDLDQRLITSHLF